MSSAPDWKSLSREERNAIVHPLVIEGLSSTHIAARFTNITRNAIIGLCHRNKWQLKGGVGRKPNEIANTEARQVKPVGQKGQPKVNAIINAVRNRRKAPTPPPMDSEPFDMEDGPGNDVTALVGIMENRGCKWITGDPLGQHGYCGQPFKAGSDAWCAEHYAIVYPWGRAR